MDQNHNRQSLTQFITSQFLKRITQLLLSVSVFSFLFSYSSWHSFFLHSSKFHFSTFSFQLLSHTMDKNCIFLICNGILVFLAKTSGFFRFLHASHLNNQSLFKKIEDGDGLETTELLLEKEVSLETTGSVENVVAEEEEEEEEEYSWEGESDDSTLIVEDEEQKAPSGLLSITGEEEEEEEGRGEGGIQTTENEENEKELDTGFLISEEEEEEEENGVLSTEELNKIFDDFIRRMKEEIRIEAQQQLVMAQ